MQKETKSLLEDRDKLDKIPFVLEREREQGLFYRGSEDSDVEMDRRDIGASDGEDEDIERDDDENDDNMEGYSTDDGEVRGESGDGADSESDQGEDDETDGEGDTDSVVHGPA
jgi:hypothetical protein